jgi:hypothetical protein
VARGELHAAHNPQRSLRRPGTYLDLTVTLDEFAINIM